MCTATVDSLSLLCRHIFIISRSSSYAKVIGSRSRSQEQNGIYSWSAFDWNAVLFPLYLSLKHWLYISFSLFLLLTYHPPIIIMTWHFIRLRRRYMANAPIVIADGNWFGRVRLCICVCVSLVWALTFEGLDLETSFWYAGASSECLAQELKITYQSWSSGEGQRYWSKNSIYQCNWMYIFTNGPLGLVGHLVYSRFSEAKASRRIK